jgi:hypothetical protein
MIYVLLVLQLVTLGLILRKKPLESLGEVVPKFLKPDDTDVLQWTPPEEEEKNRFEKLVERIKG